MKKYSYKVERVTGELQEYLNKQAQEGWRCISVSASTGLGWTQLVVLEKEEDGQEK